MADKNTPLSRVALIHALEESMLPTRRAFAVNWPEAKAFDLLDTSLAVDLAYHGKLDDAMHHRFEFLSDYACKTEGEGGSAQGVLFTCSAFGPAIDAVKRRLSIPVLRPNEAAFEQALKHGKSIGLVVTFGPSLPSLTQELEVMAAEIGQSVDVSGVVAVGALAALKEGNGALHDKLAADAALQLSSVDVVVLGQFSLARARASVEEVVDVPVITTPDCAVLTLRRLIQGK